jgi:O-antigen/teichoic acid export membrane protein
LSRLGIDRAVGYTVIAKGWTALSGIVSLVLLTRFLSPDEQGFYFTFVDILALQIFFELGLSTVVMQFASHERAQLNWTADGRLEGDAQALQRLGGLLRLSLLWYAVVSLLVLLVVLPTGLVFFGTHAPRGHTIAWQLPWLWIVIVTACTLAISPLMALLEGCGLVAEIAFVLMTQSVVGSLLFWLTLVLHWGLFTAPVTNTVFLLALALWLWRRKRAVINQLLRTPGGPRPLDWKREVWPFQWKIAVSWLTGYFIFKLFDPVLFAYGGAAAAGRMGLCLNVMSALAAISLAWITTKSAPFGSLIARGEFDELDRRFFPSLRQSLLVVATGGLLFWCAAYYLHTIHHPLGLRLLDPTPLALLVGSTIINHIVISEAIYLRAHKQEPFLAISVLNGCLVGLSTLVLGRLFGALGMMCGYFTINLCVGLIGGTWIFITKRDLWHRPASTEMP